MKSQDPTLSFIRSGVNRPSIQKTRPTVAFQGPNRAGAEPRRGFAATPMIWFKRKVKTSFIYPLLRPRRFMMYCVGPAKSGTVSVNGMFSANYRAAPRSRVSRDHCLGRRLSGRTSEEKHGVAPASETGPAVALGSGLFQPTLRCLYRSSSISSRSQVPSHGKGAAIMAQVDHLTNQHLNVDVSNRQPERRLRELFFGPPNATYSRGEGELERLGLFPLDGYLGGWAAHYRRVLDAVPMERLLILRTEDLAISAGRLATFLSIPRRVQRQQSHLHHFFPLDHGVFHRLDTHLVEEKVASNCETVSARLKKAMGAQPW